MKILKSTLIATALLSLAGLVGPVSAAVPMTAHQEMVVKSCMAMPGEQMLRNSQCKSVMAKLNIRRSDMQTMISCREMSRDGIMDNPDCTSMLKSHPDIMSMPRGG